MKFSECLPFKTHETAQSLRIYLYSVIAWVKWCFHMQCGLEKEICQSLHFCCRFIRTSQRRGKTSQPHISSPCSQSGSCLLSTRTASPSPRQAGTRTRNQPPWTSSRHISSSKIVVQLTCQDNGRGLHVAGVQRILHSSRYLPAQASTPGCWGQHNEIIRMICQSATWSSTVKQTFFFLAPSFLWASKAVLGEFMLTTIQGDFQASSTWLRCVCTCQGSRFQSWACRWRGGRPPRVCRPSGPEQQIIVIHNSTWHS